MQQLFDCPVGLSDHTMGIGVAVASVALGACLIEKHFTLSRAEGGVDSVFSIEPEEMKQLVIESERAWQALGRLSYGPGEQESKSLKFRRSLYICRDMAEGEVLTTDNLRIVRPGYGLEPKYYEVLIGKKVNRAVKKGTPLSWDLI
jgi:N-acetylneuraminate synthase